jgi:hypothetical protein
LKIFRTQRWAGFCSWKNFFSAVDFSRSVSMSGLNGWTVCRFHGARGGAPEGKRNGNYRHGGRTKEMIEVWKLIKSLR